VLSGDHGLLPHKAAEALRAMVGANGRLRQVVADVLDLARIEHGELRVSVKELKLSELLARVLPEVESACKEKGLSLTRSGDEGLRIAVDAEQAERMLTAVLHNAAQYTDKGGITVTSAERGNQVVVTVQDSGVGIPDDQLPHVFARPKLGSLLHGKGASLCLARQLAKLMGAEVILMSSELNHGSTFAVMFPKPASLKQAEPQKAEVAV
jgi:signal transduction histidine kinase